MSKHTPGPWEREGYVVQKSYKSGDIELYMECHVYAGNEYCAPEIAMANAKLVTASPDLAAACLRLVQAYQRGEQRGGSVKWEDIDDAFFAATAALDKADIEYKVDEENEQETTH